MDDARRNRCWLEGLRRQHPVADEFAQTVLQCLEEHGYLEEPLPPALRAILEAIYRREHDRARRHAQSVRTLAEWHQTLQGVAESLRDARKILGLVKEAEEPERPVRPPTVSAGRTVH